MIDSLHDMLQYLHVHFPLLQNGICVASAVTGVVLLARQFERRWPIDPNLDRSDIVADWKATAANVAIAFLAGPLTAFSGTAIVRALGGGGLIHLRTDGWWYGLSLLTFVVAMDLFHYANHRVYHVVPILWKLHSFHHSAEAVTFATGARHHWMQRVLEGACFPIISLLFSAPADLVAVSAVIFFFPDGCAHLNVKFPLGRAITWVNSPQWHRIHHSVLPEHQNKNFASLLPLWDIVFGTAWIPGPNEYPATGLVPGEKCDVLTSIVWPFRHHVRRLQGYLRDRTGVESLAGMRRLGAKVSGTPND